MSFNRLQTMQKKLRRNSTRDLRKVGQDIAKSKLEGTRPVAETQPYLRRICMTYFRLWPQQ